VPQEKGRPTSADIEGCGHSAYQMEMESTAISAFLLRVDSDFMFSAFCCSEYFSTYSGNIFRNIELHKINRCHQNKSHNAKSQSSLTIN